MDTEMNAYLLGHKHTICTFSHFKIFIKVNKRSFEPFMCLDLIDILDQGRFCGWFSQFLAYCKHRFPAPSSVEEEEEEEGCRKPCCAWSLIY